LYLERYKGFKEIESLSAKSNGKVRVTARKQIIQKLYEYFDKNQ
jgi:hypothetical protein